MPNDIANNMADTIHQLEKELKELKEENKVLMQECDRLIKEKGELLKKSEQIAHYSDENAKLKELLRKAVEDMNNSVNDVHCKYCSKWHTDQCQGTSHLDCYVGNKFKWRYADEALTLIGEDGEQKGGEINGFR